MTDTELLKSIHFELVEIRKLLAKQPAPTASRPAASSYSSGSSGSNDEIPQPSEIVRNPGEFSVHFGKNQGVALRDLSERSLSFYASVKAPRLDRSGKPFPPREADAMLENAARTLWHQNKGTLAGHAGASPAPAEKPASAQNLDEDVPF